MKKILFTILILLLFSVSSNIQAVNADFGPKPSIQITIKGVDAPYSFDLLSEQLDEDDMEYIENQDWVEGHYYKENYPDSLIGYRDKDDFSSYQRYNGIGNVRQESEHVFNVNYYGPSTYKLVIVTEDDNIIISEQIVNIVFDTVITWDLTDVDLTESSYGEGELTGNMGIGTPDNYVGEGKIVWMTVWRTIVRVIATVLLELVVFLFLFRYKEKDTLKKMILINVLSQTILSIFLVLGYLAGNVFGLFTALLIGEAVVFIGEAIIFMFWFKEGTKTKAFWYAIVANSFSLIISLAITPLLH